METAEEFADRTVWSGETRVTYRAKMKREVAARDEAIRAAAKLEGKREAFAQVSRELTEWSTQHVNAGYTEMQKTLLVAARVYKEKSEYAEQPEGEGGDVSSAEQTEREVRRRLDALQEATRLPRARCIGLLDAEYADKFREQRAALDKIFGELELAQGIEGQVGT